MPRPRPPGKPSKKRVKLRNANEINLEIAKLYRQLDNNQVSPAVAARKVDVLAKLRAGMPDPVETDTTNFSHPGFNILVVPHDHFLTGEQIEAYKQGLSVVDIDKCTPLALEPAPGADVVPMRGPRRIASAITDDTGDEPDPRLAALENYFADKPPGELRRLAEILGLRPDDDDGPDVA